MHRYDFDGRYAYISPTAPGYIGNIVKILDLRDPAKPEEVGRWWIPGQHEAGGETYPWDNYVPPRCHHPLRMGNRLYVSYWHHGMFILDIEDMARPRLVSQFNTGPAHPHPTHTALPIPGLLRAARSWWWRTRTWPSCGRRRRPSPGSSTSRTSASPCRSPPSRSTAWTLTASRKPCPAVTSRPRSSAAMLPFAWFARGLRLLDISDPFRPREVGCYEPDPPAGCERASSNDVTTDDRGLLYLLDRQRGLDIIESSVYGT